MKDKEMKKILIYKPANEWLDEAKNLEPIKPLFYPLWNEGEICFFFGMAGIGKTLFAAQIGIEIAKNQKILYCDFELSTRQFFKRSNVNETTYNYPENFYRLVIDSEQVANENEIINEIENISEQENIKVIIIDNITWLLMDGQEASKAAPFMKRIVELKNKLGLSILILAHVPKKNEPAPIQLTDMAGSMVLQNFIDASFAIGKSSKGEEYRYIKQTKNRSDEVIYHEDNVLILKLQKFKEGRVGFQLLGNDRELYHIVRNENELRDRDILKLHAEGLSHREIASRVGGISHTTVGRVIKGA